MKRYTTHDGRTKMENFEAYCEGFSEGRQVTIRYMKRVLELFDNPTTIVDVFKAFVKTEYEPEDEQT